MNENVDPNKIFPRKEFPGSMGKASSENIRNYEATTDVKVALIDALSNLEDGKVVLVDDLVAIRAGPETYHPIKTLKV